MPQPIRQSTADHDMSARVSASSAVVASPSAAAETLVCQIPALSGDAGTQLGVFLSGVVSFTVGTSGTAIRVRIRQGSTAGAGTVVADTGAITGGVSATNLLSQDIQGFDTSPPASGVYHMSLQVTGGAAASTVSAANLFALNV